MDHSNFESEILGLLDVAPVTPVLIAAQGRKAPATPRVIALVKFVAA